MVTIEIDEKHYDYLMEMLDIAKVEFEHAGMRMEAARATETISICSAAGAATPQSREGAT